MHDINLIRNQPDLFKKKIEEIKTDHDRIKFCGKFKNNISLITLSGFKKNNPLYQNGNINFHVESEEYNIIEMTHHIWLLSIIDYLIEAKKIK